MRRSNTPAGQGLQAVLLAVGLAVSLTACGAGGTGTSGAATSPAPVSGSGAPVPAPTATPPPTVSPSAGPTGSTAAKQYRGTNDARLQIIQDEVWGTSISISSPQLTYDRLSGPMCPLGCDATLKIDGGPPRKYRVTVPEAPDRPTLSLPDELAPELDGARTLEVKVVGKDGSTFESLFTLQP